MENMRQLFEEKVIPSFPDITTGLQRKPNGEYGSGTIEDHWQTFQEGFAMGLLFVEKMIGKKIEVI